MTKENKYILGAILVGMTYRLLMGMQGIDSSGTGFCMTFYQNIFTHPEAMPYYFNYYLTGIIGGLWQMAFGQFGLMGFRILETLILTAAIGITYLTFRPWLTRTRTAVIAILISSLFPSFIQTFHYDTLSFLLMAISVYAMMQWQRQERQGWLIVAGIMIGVSYFARFVNGSLVILTLVPFFWSCRQTWKKGLTDAAIYFGGITTGAILVVSLMMALGHWPYFVEGQAEAMGSIGYRDTFHTSGNLVGVYMKSYLDIALQIIAIALITLFYGDAGHLSRKWKLPIRALLLVILFVLVFTSQPYLSAVALCTLLIVTTSRILPWAVYALLCAYLFPIGSDAGIPGIVQRCGALLIIPAACCYLRLVGAWKRNAVVALCVCISVLMMYRMDSSANGKSASRMDDNTIAVPGTLNVLVDEGRAMRYRNAVARIQQHSDDNPLLLIANQASELYYATGKLPFTGNTQMDAFVDEDLPAQMDRQHDRYKRLPVIAFLKHDADTEKVKVYRQTLKPWMEHFHYQAVYDDADIQLFKAVSTTNN